jgi:hypothetical protein
VALLLGWKPAPPGSHWQGSSYWVNSKGETMQDAPGIGTLIETIKNQWNNKQNRKK